VGRQRAFPDSAKAVQGGDHYWFGAGQGMLDVGQGVCAADEDLRALGQVQEA
jgi:hypothetical protein